MKPAKWVELAGPTTRAWTERRSIAVIVEVEPSAARHAIMVAIALLLVTSRAAAQTLPIWQVDHAAAFTIGIDDTRDGHALHDVRAAVRLSDGRIVVADGGSSELRYFTARGDLIRRSGGHLVAVLRSFESFKV